MVDLVSSLTSGVLPRLGQDRAEEGGFRGWLSLGLYHVVGASANSRVELQITDLEQLIRYISFDFERFSLSSRESFAIAFVEKASHKLVGWPLLKLYYSAFFAAHAIMRSQGGGVVKIEGDHARHVNSILSFSHPSATTFKPGMYTYQVIRSQSGAPPSLILEPARKDGGVHESFWKIFCYYLEDQSQQAITRGGVNAADYSAGVFELSGAIKDGASGVWFSSVRNEINYQHAYEAWFPLRKRSEAVRAIEKEAFAESNTFRMNIPKNKTPLIAFTNLSRYFACLNIEISEYVSRRSTVGHAFGQKWRRMIEQA